MVLEIIEYELFRTTAHNYTVTDGSELVTFSRKGFNAEREGVIFKPTEKTCLYPAAREVYYNKHRGYHTKSY
jgi:hypothetical protein